MAILDYEIGGNEIKNEGGEALLKIPCNRTLILNNFNSCCSDDLVIEHNIRDINELFERYQPQIEVNLIDENLRVNTETVKFKKIEDFNIENITEQNKTLKRLQIQLDFYKMFIMHKDFFRNINKEELLKFKGLLNTFKEELKEVEG